MVAMQRSQRTGFATWSTMRDSTSRPLCTTAPSRLESSRRRGSCVVTARARLRSVPTAGCHVLGVEGAGHLQRAQARALGRVGGERCELLERPRGDDLAGAVDVGRR